jgi:hypothetical protein
MIEYIGDVSRAVGHELFWYAALDKMEKDIGSCSQK